MSKWLIAGFVCCALSLLVPPLGLIGFIAGIVALVRGQVRPGVLLVVLSIGLPVAGAYIVQAVFVKPYRVPSEAMVPTLKIGDRFLMSRLSANPHVGDIVVLNPPAGAEDASECGVPQVEGRACPTPTRDRAGVSFIKRIVAGPGDRLAIVDGHVILNGKRRPEPFIAPCGGGDECNFPEPITIPPDHWFMMGDNRGASDDSRYWGPVPGDWILGRAIVRYWPAGRAGTL